MKNKLDSVPFRIQSYCLIGSSIYSLTLCEIWVSLKRWLCLGIWTLACKHETCWKWTLELWGNWVVSVRRDIMSWRKLGVWDIPHVWAEPANRRRDEEKHWVTRSIAYQECQVLPCTTGLFSIISPLCPKVTWEKSFFLDSTKRKKAKYQFSKGNMFFRKAKKTTTCPRVFIAMLFIAAQSWKPAKCPTDKHVGDANS